jgi:hypothetical protein
MAVVPLDEQGKLALQYGSVIWNNELACALGLDGADETFDDGQATVLLNRAESLTDAPASAPAPEAVVGELSALVGDGMARTGLRIADSSTEESFHSRRGRLRLEHHESHYSP